MELLDWFADLFRGHRKVYCPYCHNPIHISRKKLEYACRRHETERIPAKNLSIEKNKRPLCPVCDKESSHNTEPAEMIWCNANQTEEDKKNVMTNILKEQEEKEINKPKKDDSFKAAVLSIIVIIVIIHIDFLIDYHYNKKK